METRKSNANGNTEMEERKKEHDYIFDKKMEKRKNNKNKTWERGNGGYIQLGGS